MRSERAIRRCVRCAAESRCAAAARSGIIGLTIRDSSCCHRMAAGIRQVCGRLSAARSCVCNAAKCVRLRRRGCDGFVLFTHSAWLWRVSPVAIRWLGSDLRSGQRREYSPNMPAPALRRVVASGLFRRRPLGMSTNHGTKWHKVAQKWHKWHKFVPLLCHLPFWHLSVTFERRWADQRIAECRRSARPSRRRPRRTAPRGSLRRRRPARAAPASPSERRTSPQTNPT